ncbi:MAG: tRNA-guanine transglycosylase [Alistipes indistinctus]
MHRFSAWNRPILTDSGGFQVFSLADCRKLAEEGCRFIRISTVRPTCSRPERVIDIQRSIGADIMMAFDECPPGDAEYDYA